MAKRKVRCVLLESGRDLKPTASWIVARLRYGGAHWEIELGQKDLDNDEAFEKINAYIKRISLAEEVLIVSRKGTRIRIVRFDCRRQKQEIA